MRRVAARLLSTVLLTAVVLSIAPRALAETFLIQSGGDSSPYSFTPDSARAINSTSAYAFKGEFDGKDHSFEYYIRFDLPPELFEPGVTVQQALAWVYYGYDFTAFGDTTNDVGEVLCHPVLGPWNWTTLTWNNRPPIGPVIDGWEDITEKGMYWCDVTGLVQDWISGQMPNNGIAITSSQKRVMGFYSFRFAGVSPNFKPSLLVETLPEPSGGLWAGAAALLALARRRRARRSAALREHGTHERRIR